MLPPRNPPACCAACESRTTKRHCPETPADRCRWVVCQKCGAVTGIVGKWDGGKFIGWKRMSFTIRRRTLG